MGKKSYNELTENDKRYCRKNQIFYHRELTLNYLNETSNGRNFLSNFENLLLFGNLYMINGYIRREKGLKTKKEVFEFYQEIFSIRPILGDLIMHQYIDKLRFILSLYD